MIINFNEKYRLLGLPDGWFLQEKLEPQLANPGDFWSNVSVSGGQPVVFYDLPSARNGLVDYFVRSAEGESVEDFHAALKAATDMINSSFAERLQPGGVIAQPPHIV